MMSALSPCIAFVLLLLISRASGFSWRESILAAAVVWGVLLTIITEALSALGALSYPTVLASWLLSAAALAVLYLWFFMDKGLISESVRPVVSAPLLFVLPIGFIVALTGLITFVAPPNNYDSMTYHLGRVVHWIQNHSVQHYPTNIDRQLFMPPWAEFAVTHFYVLSGGDRLSNGVQWFSMLGSLTGVSLIAKQLGGSKESQLLAALIAACLPMGILQASSTQTDYVVTLWLVCFAHYVLRLLEVSERQLPIGAQSSLAGLSLGLALLTKPTAYLVAAPFLAWLSLSLARRWGVRSVKVALAISVIAVSINLGHYIRNLEVFGSPLAPASTISGNTNVSHDRTFLASQLISNFIRNTAVEMPTPFYYGNRIVEVAVEKLETMLRLEGDDRNFRLSPLQNHEDYAGNPIHLLLIVLCGAGLMKPEATTIANIGFGSGLTTHALLGSPRVAEVDSIEIERMMVEGAKLFHPRNRRAYEDPRSHIHIDDAKTFFAARGKRYDIIVSEPSNPWVSGVSTLFSHEFYGQVRRHLKDDGLLVQWVQSYDIGLDLLATVFKSLGSRFGDYVVYRVGAVDLLIVATPGRALPPLRPDVFAFPELAADLAHLGYQEVADLAALRVGGRRALEGVFAASDFPPNSDYFPILDQHAPRARFRGDSAQELRTGRETPVPVLAMLDQETRIPLARVRRAGPAPPPHVARARVAAEAIGIFLTGKGDAARVLPAEDQNAAVLAHSLLDGCAEAQTQWTNAVHQVIGLASPVLERSDVNIAFERIRASRCWQSLGEINRARVELLEAMNNRDGEGMRRHGEALLERPEAGLDAARHIWLMAALTGHVATGNLAGGRALWNKHSPNLSGEARSALAFRMLVAQLPP